MLRKILSQKEYSNLYRIQKISEKSALSSGDNFKQHGEALSDLVMTIPMAYSPFWPAKIHWYQKFSKILFLSNRHNVTQAEFVSKRLLSHFAEKARTEAERKIVFKTHGLLQQFINNSTVVNGINGKKAYMLNSNGFKIMYQTDNESNNISSEKIKKDLNEREALEESMMLEEENARMNKIMESQSSK